MYLSTVLQGLVLAPMGSSQISVLVQSLASAEAVDKCTPSTTGTWPLKTDLGSLSCFTSIPQLLWHFNGDEPDVQVSLWNLFGSGMQSAYCLQLNIGLYKLLPGFPCSGVHFSWTLVGRWMTKKYNCTDAFGRIAMWINFWTQAWSGSFSFLGLFLLESQAECWNISNNHPSLYPSKLIRDHKSISVGAETKWWHFTFVSC